MSHTGEFIPLKTDGEGARGEGSRTISGRVNLVLP